MSFALYREGEAAPLQYRDSEQPWADFPLLGARAPGTYTCYYHTPSAPYVLSARSEPLVVRADGYLRKPSLQAHRSGAVTEGQEVTLQCQRPATELGPVMFALLKAGSAAPVQVRPSAGRETDFSLLSVSAGDSGNYSCVYYQARAPFLASQASPRLEIRVAGEIKCGNPRPLVVAQEHCWCLYLQRLLSAPHHSEVLPMSFHGEALRTIGQAALKTTYLTQMGVGALGNAILLFHNIAPGLPGHSPRPPHTILTHMALANLLFLLSSGVTYTMAAFVLGNPLSSLGWILELLGSALELLAGRLVLLSSPSAGTVVLWSTSDAVFIGLVVWSCGSSVLLLHRHHQRVPYIHTPTGHHRCPPETTAARTILMLVVTFVIFYVDTLDILSMFFHKDALRTTSQAALKITYLTQMGIGSLVNVILFFHSISLVLIGQSQRPTDMIHTHMAVANLLVLLSPGIAHTMAASFPRKPLSGLGCKFVYYVQRVARSTALCSTCVLSTYQSFTLTPRRAEWVVLRGRAPRVAGPSCCTCWMLSFIMHITAPLKTTGPPNMHNYTDTKDKWFCSSSPDEIGTSYLWSVSDAVFIGLMVWSSGSMVLLLLRHRQRVGNGALADVTLFFCSVSPALLGHKRRPLQTTVAHMAVANSWVLLSAGPPHTMAAFVSRKPLSSLGCKFVYYIQRVARSTALCSPCILSTYQAFTLTPRRAEWAMLRGKAPRVTGPSYCTCWMLSLLMNIWIPVSISGPQDKHNYTDAQGMWFCSPSASKAGFVYLWSTSDAVFLTLMV
ncbi:hypothetical protein JEQ12_005751 [Ovis aries]|uniref:Ig-like domain-containing protein n=1 Tax=Ovis aries TaxID=9940 RepID=A0A836A6V1_SHEEP|nr:hypothetical protein JEQ12_005751 [Ovis aries]